MSDMLPTVGVVVTLYIVSVSNLEGLNQEVVFFPATVNVVVEYHKQKVQLMYN